MGLTVPNDRLAIYLDSNALIRFIEGQERGFIHLLRLVEERRATLHTSELTLAEVLVEPIRTRNDALVALYEDLLAVGSELFVTPVSRAVLRLSADNQAAYRNKGADAIHIVTAIMSMCTLFVSSDKRIHMPPGMEKLDVRLVEQVGVQP